MDMITDCNIIEALFYISILGPIKFLICDDLISA